MNIEELIALGLSKEVAGQVVTMHKKSLTDNYVPKARFDEVGAEVKALKETLGERNAQLKDFEKFKGTNEELTAKIQSLTEENASKMAEAEAKMQQMRKESAVRLSLGSMVHDADIVLGLLGTDNIKLGGDGNPVGLEEQLKPLRESKPFLFKAEEKKKPGFEVRGKPPTSSDTEGAETSTAEAIAKSLAAEKKASLESATKSGDGLFKGGN